MVFAWKAAGITYNRFLAVSARAVRRSLKEDKRILAERRGAVAEIRFAKWENGKMGEPKDLVKANAAQAVENAAAGSSREGGGYLRDASPRPLARWSRGGCIIETIRVIRYQFLLMMRSTGFCHGLDMLVRLPMRAVASLDSGWVRCLHHHQYRQRLPGKLGTKPRAHFCLRAGRRPNMNHHVGSELRLFVYCV
ncbi:predicted protein [Verticillium alfalfae VaMs.102]|uniref:Predicted protein n=1 Tax=Verticillium alfalfae (strain VaMs.102 / ATCC MYA-4576 / FGSC 10136) TaxID=526221 RepID=C9SKQ5_VERA1|nr:predicted protein [Verticillium alfalfae VaMs.102]EEY19273.1 predicted protein [Verticillium alfalfae VaMs.102]